MSYVLVKVGQSSYEVRDGSGAVIGTLEAPVQVPGDVLPTILDDLGVTDQGVRSAVEIAATGAIDMEDET